ncbi:hypothetical protein [Acetobacterium sp.]|uniref:hypothetical protein n=1 Tax=Acetobacterium sp. TaxID=1872094 RepID=UPI00271C748C|nr:hypothetical protein [Acetobacterium sp.]MDO9491260.1 hypothetical protein [Acetobacterium sp.]
MKVKEVVTLTEKTDFIFALDTFLDEFKNSEDKLLLLVEEPPISPYLTQEQYSILSAVAEKLVHDHKLISSPNWILKKKYFLKQPYFQFNTKNKEYQDFLSKNAIPEFAKRNLFFDENSIKRV